MPELPEVEYGRKIAEAVLGGKRITRARAADDRIVFSGRDPAEVHAALEGARVLAVHRHGKYLYAQLEGRPYALIHFGMTGALRARAHDPLKLAAHGAAVDDAWPPRFAKLELWVEGSDPAGDADLVFVNARRLGRVRFFERPGPESDDASLAALGFDPLLAMPRLDAFRRLLRARRTKLKGLLLDQSFAAGVGNWIADEVLYQARLDPRRRANALSPDEERALHRSLRDVIRRAVAVDADKERFPRGWLFHVRWGKQAGAETAAGEPVEFLTVAGRTTAWVPSRQR